MRTDNHPCDAVIVQAIQTPLSRARKGKLALASVLHRALIKNSEGEDYLIPNSVQDICVGNVLSPPTAAFRFEWPLLHREFRIPPPPCPLLIISVHRDCKRSLTLPLQYNRDQCIGTGMGAAAVFEVENMRASL